MNKEKMGDLLAIIGKSGICVAGDLVLEKHVDYEVGNVESGGTGIVVQGEKAAPAADGDIRDDIADGLEEAQEDNDIAAKIRQCISLLMNERIRVKKGGKDVMEKLFCQQNHWQAIYRILVDKGYCKDSDFGGFDLYINNVMPCEVNAPYRKSSVKQISQTDFNKPFEKWKFDAETSGTLRTFKRMKAIAQRFLELLEEKGL